jgi:RNA polymerase sigma factor (sigma-70 family)
MTSEEAWTVVTENRGFILSRVNRFLRRDATRGFESVRDDIEQEAFLWAFTAAMRFDGTRGVKFISFAVHYIDEGIRRATYRLAHGFEVKRSTGGMKFSRPESIPLQDMVDETYGPVDSINEFARDELRLRARARDELRRRYVAPGKNAERDIDIFLRHVLHGEIQQAIAESLGIRRQRVHQIVEMVRPAFDRWAAELRAEGEGASP